ncbi:MAG: 2,3-diphosphoglycerate-dependent phosphoglycerate mutase [Betaproteobacteria bacterium]|nr:2,3-diphosphoglycerate-dependent phosphoglycerate mutase [Betaproteobacteria bacterium]
MSSPPPLVILRHGQSQWNLENRFTGWVDVDLTEVGMEEARRAGRLMRERGFSFDLAFTSVLRRAIRTCWIALDELDEMWIPLRTDWRLNERHYGALSGLNKAETAQRFGEDQVLIWRRSYDVRPEPLSKDDPAWPGRDPRYQGLSDAQLPLTECLADTVARVEPFWTQEVLPAIRAGKRILITAHGNSLRALLKILENLSKEDVLGLNIPTAQPLVLEFDEQMRLASRRYLADPSEIEAAMAAVANQGKAQKV